MKKANKVAFDVCFAIYIATFHTTATAESGTELAMELSNPVADLVSMPIQINYDSDIGIGDKGRKTTTNIQPVIPIDFNNDINVISRTIVPVITQDDIYPGAGSQSGLGDINASFFFSPKKPTANGLIWGVGPVFLLPTASNAKLGSEKWAAGPGLVILSQSGPFTMGALANHLWSYAGDSGRVDINNTFMQPFAAYTLPNAWTFSLQSETSYNWETENWSVPVNATAAKLIFFGKLPISLAASIGYWIDSPGSGPEGIRYRLQATLILPKSR